ADERGQRDADQLAPHAGPRVLEELAVAERLDERHDHLLGRRKRPGGKHADGVDELPQQDEAEDGRPPELGLARQAAATAARRVNSRGGRALDGNLAHDVSSAVASSCAIDLAISSDSSSRVRVRSRVSSTLAMSRGRSCATTLLALMPP